MKKLLMVTASMFLLAVLNYSTAQSNSSLAANTKTEGEKTKPPASKETEQELKKLTQKAHEAVLRGDKELLSRYLADNFIYTSTDGNVVAKPDLLKIIRPLPGIHRDFEDFKVNEYNNTAVISYKCNHHEQYEMKGQKLDFSFRVTDTYTKQDGQWKVVSSHWTEMPAPKTAAKVDPAIFDTYVGQYELIDPKHTLIVTHEGDKMMGEVTGWEAKVKFEFTPENESTFFVKMQPGQTIFVKDEKGQVTHSILRFPGGQERIQKKIK